MWKHLEQDRKSNSKAEQWYRDHRLLESGHRTLKSGHGPLENHHRKVVGDHHTVNSSPQSRHHPLRNGQRAL